MFTDTVNAIICSVRIETEENGWCSIILNLQYGIMHQQCFIDSKRVASVEVLKIAGKNKWDDLKGSAIRVKYHEGKSEKIKAIGHIIHNEWIDV